MENGTQRFGFAWIREYPDSLDFNSKLLGSQDLIHRDASEYQMQSLSGGKSKLNSRDVQ